MSFQALKRRDSSETDSLPITVVGDYAENVLVQHVSQIPGVAQVNISGQQKPSVRIQVDPEELASMGLGLEDGTRRAHNSYDGQPKRQH